MTKTGCRSKRQPILYIINLFLCFSVYDRDHTLYDIHRYTDLKDREHRIRRKRQKPERRKQEVRHAGGDYRHDGDRRYRDIEPRPRYAEMEARFGYGVKHHHDHGKLYDEPFRAVYYRVFAEINGHGVARRPQRRHYREYAVIHFPEKRR